MIIISGSSNPALAKKIAKILQRPLANVEINKFPNGEKRIWIRSNLAGKTAIIIQSFSDPVDEHIIEFTLLADACKHLGSNKIIAVIPWLGYSPQDKEFRKGEPTSIHVIARIIESVGITNLITADIHSQQSLNFFSVPVEEVSALPLFVSYYQNKNLTDHIVVTVDKGATKRSTQLAKHLNLPLATLSKVRNLKTGQVTLKHLSGQVKGKHAIAIDDFVSTGSTRIKASNILKSQGLATYHDCITHALLASDSPQKLQKSHIDTILTTDTYPIPSKKRFPKLKTLSIAPLLAASIQKTASLKTLGAGKAILT